MFRLYPKGAIIGASVASLYGAYISGDAAIKREKMFSLSHSPSYVMYYSTQGFMNGMLCGGAFGGYPPLVGLYCLTMVGTYYKVKYQINDKDSKIQNLYDDDEALFLKLKEEFPSSQKNF